MVGVAQSVEHMVVAHVVAGSSPVAHPNNFRDYDLDRKDRSESLFEFLLYFFSKKAPVMSNRGFFSNPDIST